MKPKILHINYSDSRSGAAIAAKRHCEAMIRAGYDARMLVVRKSGRENYIYGATSSRIALFVNKLKIKLSSQFVNKVLKPSAVFSIPILPVKLSSHPLIAWADIIYLHWVSGGMFDSKEIERVLKTGKTVRWYMHDMNPITGGCHHALGCEKYRTECSNCPQLKGKALPFDVAKKQYKSRLRVFQKYENLEAYTPSKWLGDCVKASNMWMGRSVVVFPNVIDTSVFKPINRKVAQDFYKLDGNKKIILLGAVGWNSPYKGSNYLVDVLNHLPKEQYEVIVFGNKGPMSEKIGIKCHYTGYIGNTKSLVMAYNAADVFVSSSIAENFPNVILEAMSCGLPCAAFAVGGIPELIKHEQTGFLSKPKDSQSLAEGIQIICSMSKDERTKVRERVIKYVKQLASYDVYSRMTI